MFSPEAMGLSLTDVEKHQEEMAREVQRLLLQAHLDARGTGDVGPALQLIRGGECDEAVEILSQGRDHSRNVHTIFGEVAAKRTGYGAKGTESIHPLDEEIALPERSFTQELQRRVIVGAVQGPFDEAIERVQEATGVEISKLTAEQIVREGSQDFDDFYRQRTPAAETETGPILVATMDGKGVPMVKPEKNLRVVRRGKGKKANKKRMATVAAVYTQQPRPRTPEEVVESLFYEGPTPTDGAQVNTKTTSRPEHKRVWASLEKPKEDVAQEVSEEMERRDPQRTKKRVALTDGERALQKLVTTMLFGVTVILDFLHVLEKLWKAAYCFFPEQSDEAKAWVRKYALALLRGEVSQVIKGIRQSATKRGLRGQKRKTIDNITAYFENNQSRMRYHDYLREGLPIASGAVEGACKNLVKDRMERSGMRWSIPTAEAVLRLRATYLSGDMVEYWRFHVQAEHERLYPTGRWRPVEE